MDSYELELEGAALLDPLPGETLFSLCSRQHRIWGRPNARETCALLFGGARVGAQHDIPSGLGQLECRTKGQWGSASTLASLATLMGFYAPFVDERLFDEAIAAMRGPSVAHLKFRLGLLTSRFRANHPLKACRACPEQDRHEHGWAYWHLDHQYPGVWVCPMHEAPLWESQLKSTGVERFQWHLPDDTALRPQPPWHSDDHARELVSLSRFICAVVESGRPVGWLKVPQVEAVLHARFDVRGWCTASGHWRIASAASDYLRYSLRVRCPEELRALPASLDIAKAHIGRLRRSVLEGTHPLRLLLALHWLFERFDVFAAAFDTCAIPPPSEVDCPQATLGDGIASGSAARSVVDAMRRGQSARAAAASAGVGVATAMAWAAAGGVVVARRPKLLKEHLLDPMIRELARGEDKAVVAARYAISVETVTRVLRTEVGLHDLWRRTRWAARRERARLAWLQLRADLPNVGVKLLRALDPPSYAWLYRHDRTWLKTHCPDRHTPDPMPRRSSVDWAERDQVLKEGVERAVLQIGRSKAGRNLRLWEIYQAFPDLKPKLRELYRLPLTRLTLERALGRAMSGEEESSLFE